MTHETLGIAAILLAVVILAALGHLGTDTRSRWYQSLFKPSWQPPDAVFAPVWITLYVLFAISTVIIWQATSGTIRLRLMVLYAISMVLNGAWSFIFFRARNLVAAGCDIVGLGIVLLIMIVRAWPVSPIAAILLLPYLVWVGYASTLNWSIARAN